MSGIIACCLLIGVAIWAAAAPLRDILSIAMNDEENSHILLVPIVAAWMVWLRKTRLAMVPMRLSVLGPIVILAGWGLALYGFDQGVQIAFHGGALLVVIGAFLTFTGFAPLRHFAVVIPLLFFALPVPGRIRQQIAIPLQEIAARVTEETLTICGVNVARLGNLLEINGQQIAVAEACNGMRMVFALALVVFAFAFSMPLRTVPRLILLALAPMIALVCNVIRLVPTALFYGFGDAEVAEKFHDISGWVMLPVAFVILWKVMDLMKWLDLPVERFHLATR